jgi:hypothetical protein
LPHATLVRSIGPLASIPIHERRGARVAVVLHQATGIMPNADGVPFFGLNDFDEAAYAPFSWDVKRGAVGFNLMLRQKQFDQKQHGRQC